MPVLEICPEPCRRIRGLFSCRKGNAVRNAADWGWERIGEVLVREWRRCVFDSSPPCLDCCKTMPSETERFQTAWFLIGAVRVSLRAVSTNRFAGRLRFRPRQARRGYSRRRAASATRAYCLPVPFPNASRMTRFLSSGAAIGAAVSMQRKSCAPSIRAGDKGIVRAVVVEAIHARVFSCLPMMERTRMFSDKPFTPGRKVHIPRTIKSICTPAALARYRASMTVGSMSEFILAVIRVGLLAFACSVSRAMRSITILCRVNGLW